jgi:hypothetical protein
MVCIENSASMAYSSFGWRSALRLLSGQAFQRYVKSRAFSWGFILRSFAIGFRVRIRARLQSCRELLEKTFGFAGWASDSHTGFS